MQHLVETLGQVGEQPGGGIGSKDGAKDMKQAEQLAGVQGRHKHTTPAARPAAEVGRQRVVVTQRVIEFKAFSSGIGWST